MASQSDLEVLDHILEQTRTILSCDPIPAGQQERAVSLLDSARALTDILLQTESRRVVSEKLENWG
jgi:hypothetical protein